MEALLLSHDGGGWWWGGGLLAFLLFLALGIVVLKAFVFRGWGRGSWPDTSPDAILKRRLASGEISEADYERLSSLLRK